MRMIDADALIKFCAERWIPLNIDAVNMQPTIEPSTNCSEFPNNSDTVSRQAAIDLFPNDVLEWDTLNGYIAPHVARRLIEQLPPAQPEPKGGHWIEGGIYRDVIECYCSECGQLMTTAATVRMNYCPNCGAHMKGATT